jgi:exosortase K
MSAPFRRLFGVTEMHDPERRSLPGWLRLVPFYAIGLAVSVALERTYGRAGAEDLDWLLAPTCRVAGLLSGISFEREAGAGWISPGERMIVGPSCAGLNFLVIAFSALFLSFIHRLRRASTRALWLPAALGLAYLLTVATNSVRIIAATRIYRLGIYGGLVTKERVHLALGALLYSLTLVLAYAGIETVFDRRRGRPTPGRVPSPLVPLGWYLAFVLGVPLVALASGREMGRFVDHGVIVLSVCAFVAVANRMLRVVRPLRIGSERESAIAGTQVRRDTVGGAGDLR